VSNKSENLGKIWKSNKKLEIGKKFTNLPNKSGNPINIWKSR